MSPKHTKQKTETNVILVFRVQKQVKLIHGISSQNNGFYRGPGQWPEKGSEGSWVLVS